MFMAWWVMDIYFSELNNIIAKITFIKSLDGILEGTHFIAKSDKLSPF